jgi:CHAT domain-containing protein
LCFAGCRENRPASPEKIYGEARLQFLQGFSDQPLQAAQAGYKEFAASPDWNWKFRILAAEVLNRKGSYSQAFELLQPDPPSTVPEEAFWRRRLVQAYSLCYLNKYPEAEDRLAQAELLVGEHKGRKAEISFFRGRCKLSRHDWKDAEKYFRTILEPDATTDSFLSTYALASLGWSSMKDYRFEEAIDWYSQCLTAARALGALPLEEQALGNLGYLYAELRNFPNAEKNSAEAEKLAAKLKLPHEEERWLLDTGRNQQAEGQSGAAEESYNRALAIATQLHDTEIAAKCLNNLTVLKLRQHQTDQAEKYHRMALELGPKGEDLWMWHVYQAQISAARSDYPKAIAELQELLRVVGADKTQTKGTNYRIKWSAQKELGRVYAAQGNAREAERWFWQGIDTIEDAVRDIKDEEFRTSLRNNLPVFDDYVAFLVDQKQNEKALQVAQLGRGRTLMQEDDAPRRLEDTRVWLAKVQGYLRRNNEVLLSYFASVQECYLWVVTADQMRLFPLGIAGANLDHLIDSYKQEIQGHFEPGASLAAHRLFEVLVQPASDLTPKGAHVVILADSKIYSVNFETLISSRGGDHYWIEDVDIQNASSINLLVKGVRKRSPARGLLLMGAPVHADPHFPELPYAGKEMESVRRHFRAGEVTMIAGPDATPAAYMKSSPGLYKYIHLATHGTANAVKPLQSAIILSPDSHGTFKLLGQDIIDRKLHLNADLVTISACEGAGTNVQSLEGLEGLEWAFMRAGAHQVVAALWDVDDAVTPTLMNAFYGQLENGKNAAVALREAKLAVLHAGGYQVRPYYWASLQLYTGP